MRTIKGIIFLILGVFIGLNGLPNLLVTTVTLIIGARTLYLFFNQRYSAALTSFMFLLVLEPYFRINALYIPYLFNQYILITLGLISFNRRQVVNWNTSKLLFFKLLVLYSFLESIDLLRAFDLSVTRNIVTNTLALLSAVYIGIKHYRSNSYPLVFTSVLSNIGLILVGIVLAVHLTGGIHYLTESSFAASNGMAPVQLSYYLSLIAISIFLNIKYSFGLFGKIIQSIFFALCVAVMVLTFSRGGIYFLSIYLVFYILLNKKRIRSIATSAIFLVVAFYSFDYLIEYTSGKILDRYTEQGVSNRDLLVSYAIDIFNNNMIFGVGTGNYHEIVSYEEYFGSRSGVHNEFARSLAEHGFLGLVTFVFFVFSIFYALLKQISRNREYLIVVILICSFTFGCVHNGMKLGLQEFVLTIVSGQISKKVLKN